MALVLPINQVASVDTITLNSPDLGFAWIDHERDTFVVALVVALKTVSEQLWFPAGLRVDRWRVSRCVLLCRYSDAIGTREAPRTGL